MKKFLIIMMLFMPAYAEDIQDFENFAKSLLSEKGNAFTQSSIGSTADANLTPKDGAGIDYRKQAFDEAVTAGKVAHPDSGQDIPDNAGLTQKDYREIAMASDDNQTKYKKDMEEESIQNVLKDVEKPEEKLKELGVDTDCKYTPGKDDITTEIYTLKKPTVISEAEEKSCKESEPRPFTCERKLVLKCKGESECDRAGIIKTSVQSDMKFEYSGSTLTVGTIADNYWCGHCQTYDRKTTFEVKNKNKITEFKLLDVGFDDYLWIKINGQTVYVGPDGGDRIEVTAGRGFWGNIFSGVSNGAAHSGCERNTNWHRVLNLDLKSYLKEGANEIWMRVVVAGCGEGWMNFKIKQFCCDNWDETWENICEKELRQY